MTSTQPAHTDTLNDSIVPLVLSIGLHGALLAGLLFYKAPSPPIPTGIETTLISSGELAQIQAQIQENAALAEAKGEEGDSNQSASSPPVISDSMQAYNEELLAKEAEYQRQMAEYAKSLDAEISAEMQAHEDSIKQAQQQEAQMLEELRKQAQNHDQKIQNNKEELEKAAQERDKRIADEEQKLKQLSGRAVGASNPSVGNNKSSASAGNNAASTNNKTSGAGSSNIAAALIAHVEPHWRVPNGKKGKKVTAKISVDDHGNVLSVSISGGDSVLNQSLEDAIYNASPLTPIIGTPHRRLSATFSAE